MAGGKTPVPVGGKKAGTKGKNGVIRVKESAGRPEINLLQPGETIEDFWFKIDNWLMKGVEGTTIAARLGCSADVFYNWGHKKGRWGKGTEYPDFTAYKRFRYSVGNDTLKERQYDAATGIYGVEEKVDKEGNRTKRTIMLTKPNVHMLMFLGKHRLGQLDTIDVTTNGENINANVAPVVIKRVINVREDKRSK